ncbi:MAG: hypothetical protein N3B10_11515 [Armatimonadetes bacterium]|nr:hypothetical protein [Armatimonadota bacterium]
MHKTHETEEVQCRCGERIQTVPSPLARCPGCGRRLFWNCRCGALVERTVSRCPSCGATRERLHSETRSPLRLRRILVTGLVGALVFSLLGYLLIEAISRLLPHSGAIASSSTYWGGNIIVQTLKGVLLLFVDLIRLFGQVISKHPMLLIFTIAGFLIAAALAARQQQLSWKRLKRHLRRRWEEFVSKKSR